MPQPATVLPPLHHLPEAMQALRNDRERAFVWNYMLNGCKGGPAALAAGYAGTPGSARVRAFELLHREDIQAALRELGMRYLGSLMPKALVRLGELLDNKNHRQHAKAIEMTLSRTGVVERTALDVNVSGQVNVNHTDAAVEDLRRLKSIGVPRAELERIFGFSGLSRYEKLLAAADAKVIEHQPTEAAADGKA